VPVARRGRLARRGWLVTVVLLGILALPRPTGAHESRPGYLELTETEAGTWRVLWKRPINGEVEIRISPLFPESCGLVGAAQGEEGASTLLVRAELACTEPLVGQRVAIDGLETTITDVMLRVYYLDGASETHLLRPSSTSAEIGQSAGAWRRAAAYLRLGIQHIVQGVDHLLFVLGLLLIVQSTGMLLKTITSFTVAHSITLAIATLGYAEVPSLPLNAVIALSILFLAPEILRAQRGESSLTTRHPWTVAFAFGLLHGFGYATGLTEMGLPPAEIPLALFTFNVGVEIGQLGFVGLVLLLARSFRTLEIRWPKWALAVPAYAVGTLGAFWTIDRTVALLAAVL
jgi:hydrogenase/urease accessory protein HupE